MNGYSLFLSGISNATTLSLSNAMVSLERSKNIYEIFFPNKIHLIIARIDLTLGKVYV